MTPRPHLAEQFIAVLMRASDEFFDTRRTALAMGEAGVRVFACVPKGKKPATHNGFHDSTAGMAELKAQFPDGVGSNLAICPDNIGCAVLDVDGAEGEATLAALVREHGPLPETLTITTPRGGKHYWFKGRVASTVGKLGPKIDTRGHSGYVLLPPSHVKDEAENIDGVYAVACFKPMADLPAWIATLAHASRDGHAAKVADLDQPHNVERARVMLRQAQERGHIPGREEDGDDYPVCCAVLSLGLSVEKGLELALEEWAPPPHSADLKAFLQQTFRNADEYMQNEPGAWGVLPAQEVFAHALANIEPPAESKQGGRVVVLRSEGEQERRTPQKMLIEGWLPQLGTVGIHAPFGSYKSFILADALLSVAAGLPAFGRMAVNRTGPVIYLAGEGLSGFETLRRPAWRIARDIATERELPIYTVDGVPQVRSTEDIKRYLDAIATSKVPPVLIGIDPVARAMAGLNENDARDAGLYLEMVEGLAKLFNCCVLSVMHEGKDESRGARGSSAFAAGLDNVWKQEADTEGRAVKLTPVKLKDDAGIDAICLKGRQVLVPRAGKSSLVFDWLPSDEYTGRGRMLTRGQVGRALQDIGATAGKTVTTHVLATELCGPDADEQTVMATERRLRRGAGMRYRAYVAHQGEGRGDATLWTLPATENGVGV